MSWEENTNSGSYSVFYLNWVTLWKSFKILWTQLSWWVKVVGRVRVHTPRAGSDGEERRAVGPWMPPGSNHASTTFSPKVCLKGHVNCFYRGILIQRCQNLQVFKSISNFRFFFMWNYPIYIEWVTNSPKQVCQQDWASGQQPSLSF